MGRAHRRAARLCLRGRLNGREPLLEGGRAILGLLGAVEGDLRTIWTNNCARKEMITEDNAGHADNEEVERDFLPRSVGMPLRRGSTPTACCSFAAQIPYLTLSSLRRGESYGMVSQFP